MTSIPFPAASGLAQRFTRLTVDLGRVIGQHAHKRPEAVPLLTALCWWLQRLRLRFERLAAHAAAGTLPDRPAPPRANPRHPPAQPPAQPSAQPPAQPPAQPQARPRQRLPATRAWLLGLIPPMTYPAAMCGHELRHLLADPDMLALLELAPQARRLLRPLCRMLTTDPLPALGIEAHHNRPPARPWAPAAAAVAAAPAAAPAAPPAPPTPYGQGPRDFDPDQYHRHPFLPGHLARRPGG